MAMQPYIDASTKASVAVSQYRPANKVRKVSNILVPYQLRRLNGACERTHAICDCATTHSSKSIGIEGCSGKRASEHVGRTFILLPLLA